MNKGSQPKYSYHGFVSQVWYGRKIRKNLCLITIVKDIMLGVSLIYRVSARTGSKATQRNPVLKIKTTETKTKDIYLKVYTLKMPC
ncbi:hypothetical protein I79_001535 [Cricetulus griseus]|uniref:Uncharacterized protein n=1 Tax=Cricetulus griseus TaxID=10029 RepID=G3GV09_CRIGR|nr:hypothetical protein I79_001535 [Cricetulus griseus]